jgi:ABC-type dipeptide/oligopeptide/nickel transport systems, permease components
MSVIATPKTTDQPTEGKKQRVANLWRDAAIRFSRNKLAMGGLVIVIILFLMAIFADLIAPYPYDFVLSGVKYRAFPSADHWMGIDENGRDEFSRIVYGARISLTVGFSVQVIALLIGVSLGLLAGFAGGWVDFVVMRIIEVFTAIPQMLFALFLVAIFGNGLLNIIIAIGLIAWVDICRLTRAQIFSLREKEYVEAAKALGTTPFKIAVSHLLPNALTPLIVAVTIGIPNAIFTEAGLSFLGIGVNDPLPSWGKMVGNAATNPSYLQLYWHLALFPTIFIALTMLSFSLVGDGLRDALDPRSRK